MAWYQKGSDDFNRADESPLSGGGNWTTKGGYSGGLILSSNVILGNTGEVRGSYWSGASVGNNHKIIFTLVGYSQSDNQYFMGRFKGAGTERNDYFFHLAASTDCIIAKSVNGSDTTLGSSFALAKFTYTFGIVCDGTTISAHCNGNDAYQSRTDSTHSTGGVGLLTYLQAGTTLDNALIYDDVSVGHPAMASRGRIVNCGGMGGLHRGSIVNYGGH